MKIVAAVVVRRALAGEFGAAAVGGVEVIGERIAEASRGRKRRERS
jgi:hypothetical protein